MLGSLLSLALVASPLQSAAAAAVDQHRENLELPGVAAAVLVGGDIVYAGASGVADLESGRMLDADTPIYAGSLSKVFTAVLILNMIERGELGFDTRAEFGQDLRRASVRELLSHASGLPREGDFGYWFSGVFPDRGELLAYLGDVQLQSEPGAQLAYSNIGYAALGLLAEAVTISRFDKLLSNRVLEPLGLDDSGAPGPVDGIARGYTPVGRLVPNESRPFAGVGAAVGERRLREYHDAAAMTPAFGIYTSARDLARLAGFLMGHGGEEVLSAEYRDMMFKRQASGWGLGIGLESIDGREVARHSGWFAAHRSQLVVDSSAGVAVAVLTISDDGQPARLADGLYRLALDARVGNDDPGVDSSKQNDYSGSHGQDP